MSTYCIGDLHGCYDEFMQLLELIKFDPSSDKLILTGDLIGRGPYPVKTMQAILDLQDNVTSVLGNHDLNFLAVHYDFKQARTKDNLQELLDSSIREDIVKFFLKCPLLFLNEDLNLVVAHAGIYPQWSIKRALKESAKVTKVLQNKDKRNYLLKNMYAEKSDHYDKRNRGIDRWRFAINSFTRMRLCEKNYVLDFKTNDASVEEASKQGLTPWFALSKELRYKKKTYTLVFGHWAALKAQCNVEHIKALDAGCIWGGDLLAWRYEDNRFFKVPSKGYASISIKSADNASNLINENTITPLTPTEIPNNANSAMG